jgi:hypothetical protein
MASQTKTQPNSGFNRRLFLAGAAGGAMLPVAAGAVPKKRGVYTDATLTDKVADFSYQNDSLAEMIVNAWTDASFRNSLLAKAPDGTSPNAKAELANRGIYLANPLVITEAEYENGHRVQDRNAVVFVLPDPARITAAPAGQTLLETAKMLMAVTPNGI